MNARFATPDETASWDDLLVANPDKGNVFQTTEVAETKRKNSWTPRYVMVGSRAITVLEKSVPFLGNYWYLPKGPGVADQADLDEIITSLSAFAKKHGVFC